MPKVAVFGSYPDSLLNFRGQLLQAMLEAGHEVHTLSPYTPPEIVRGLKDMGVKHHIIPLSRTGLNPATDLFSLLYLIRFLRRLRPDTLLAYTIKPVVYGGIAARLTGTSFYPMITGLGYAFSGKGKKGKLIKQIASILHYLSLQGAKQTIFQNPDNLNYFRDTGLLKAPKAKLVNGSGVDLLHFNQQPLPDKPSFLMMARLLEDKGIREYVDAARKIKQTYPEATFQVAGWIDDTPLSISQEELNSWINEGVIEYLGHLKDVRPALSNCSVFVLPSYYPEGIPRTVLEAMSTGRPIITTDMPGCRETVIKQKNGFLVPIKDSDALANAMRKFLKKPTLIDTMATESRKIAEYRFDVNKVNQEILKTMELA